MSLPSIKISIPGARAILNRLGRSGQLNEIEIRLANEEIGRQFIARITEYPPESEGNRPPPPYWIRGKGRVINRAGDINPESQNFKESWVMSTKSRGNSATTTISTPVTYAPFLIHPKKQSWFHKMRGWKTTDEVSKIVGTGQVAEETIFSRIREKLRSIFS